MEGAFISASERPLLRRGAARRWKAASGGKSRANFEKRRFPSSMSKTGENPMKGRRRCDRFAALAPIGRVPGEVAGRKRRRRRVPPLIASASGMHNSAL